MDFAGAGKDHVEEGDDGEFPEPETEDVEEFGDVEGFLDVREGRAGGGGDAEAAGGGEGNACAGHYRGGLGC